MPRSPRGTKTQTGYRIPPDIERAMTEMIENGDYSNRAEIINTAVRYWLDHKDTDIPAEIERFLQSERGEQLVLDIVKKAKKKKD